MSDHPSAQLITALVDQELAGARRDEVQRHVDACERCRVAYQTHRSLKHAISRLGTRVALPEAVRIRIEAPGLAGRSARSQVLRFSLASLAAIAAAAALLVVMRAPEFGPELVHELVADHLRYAPEAMPAEVASDQADTVREFFVDKLPFVPVVPLLDGAALIGGRLCRIEGRKVELLFYEKDGRRLSMYVSDGIDAPAQCRGEGATALCGRSIAGLTYIVIGDLGKRELQQMLDGLPDGDRS